MAMVLQEHANENVDLLSVLKMLIIHDIVEIDAGDTFIYDDAGALDRKSVKCRQPPGYSAFCPKIRRWNSAPFGMSSRHAKQQKRSLPARWIGCSHSCTTSSQVAARHTPGVTAPVVLDRKSPISHASDTLWEAAQRIIAEGVERGF